MEPTAIILVACGIFAIAGAVADWEWFMNNHKAKFFIGLFGRGGTRVFYGVLGSAIATVGVLLQLGIIEKTTH